MTIAWPAIAMVAASLLAAGLGAAAVALAPRPLLVTNHAGVRVPAVLGVALVTAMAGGLFAVVLLGRPGVAGLTLEAAGAAALLAVVGLLDDAFGGEARGFRGHLGRLLRGRPTTGVLKLAVGVTVGVVLAVLAGGGVVRVIASAVLIVLSINLWNALDVVPGRALKWGIVALVGCLGATMAEPFGILVGAGLGAAVGVLPFDLLERGMLGDAGSNPLGLIAGLGLSAALPTWGVVVAAGVVLALQVAAETVTISRLIDSAPPLRWFDRLGRRP